MEHLDLRGHQAQVVLQDLLEHQELVEHREHLEHLDLQVLQDLQELAGLMELQVMMDLIQVGGILIVVLRHQMILLPKIL
jgi:NADPH-dependent 7-cyano-7-deazaguanine reductase QueF